LPIVSDFAQGKGTPLVVNTDNGRGYVLIDNAVVPLNEAAAYVLDFPVDPTGSVDSTAGLQAAINTGKPVILQRGTYLAHGLTQSTAGQCFFGIGEVIIKKNANGTLFSSTGHDVQLHNIKFFGDAASPTFTGDNLNFTGNNVVLRNCGSRWTTGRAVKATGQHLQVEGTNDIYQTTDATGSGYDIEIGVSGTATLYHHIANIYTSQPTGGIKFVDCGGQTVIGSQFGKLTVAAGTRPAGVNGGMYVGNRILGNSSVDISNSAFAANQIGAITLTFETGTSGHTFNSSNIVESGATIADNSNLSFVADLRDVPIQTYSPTWTGASSDPDIGDGDIDARYSKDGKWVTVSIHMVAGSTTTFGSGTWYFSLPFTPATDLPYIGQAVMFIPGIALYVGAVESLIDGTARCHVWADNAASNVRSNIPSTWVADSYLRLTLRYATG
jgi:hypothetical protein